jgi:hypothetical protein
VDQLLLLPDVADPAAAAAGGGGSGAGSSSVGQVTAAEAAALLSSDSSSSDTPQEELLQALLEAAAEPADQLAGRLITALQVRPDGQVPAAVLPDVTFSVSTRNGSIPLQQQLQQLRVQLQQWTPAATAAGGGAWVPVQEAGSWSAVQAVLQDIDHHQQQQQDEAGQQQQQQQQQQVTYPVPAELRQLPSKAGLYRLLASYVRDLPGGQGRSMPSISTECSSELANSAGKCLGRLTNKYSCCSWMHIAAEALRTERTARTGIAFDGFYPNMVGLRVCP